MRYVTNYVSKFKDSQSNASLYVNTLDPAEAAYRHLRDMKPCEPEMIIALSSIKTAWTSNSTKRFVPPGPLNAESNSIVMKYHSRTNEQNVTLIDFLRTHDTTKTTAPLYKRQKCLVGIKYLSYFNYDFFFQFILMSLPHKSFQELKHPNHDMLPESLQYFASCLVYLPQLMDEVAFREMLEKEGHKKYFIDNVLNYLTSLRTIYNLWKIQVLRNDDFFSMPTNPQSNNLDPMQIAVVDTIKSFLHMRTAYYNHQCHPYDIANMEWTKVVSVAGKAGTGKTKCLHAAISYCIQNHFNCLVATPTGFLASSYRAHFDTDIDSNTVHSSFLIPIDDSPTQVNWALTNYHIIIIDEVSMVTARYFEHIMSTLRQLPTRPILVICGDKQQLPPLTNINNRTTTTTSVYQVPEFSKISITFTLTRQHRCIDEDYEKILEHIRYWKPTLNILNTLHNGRLLHNSSDINDDDLLAILQEHASSTFLTVSRKAVARINALILQHLFQRDLYVGTVQMDNDDVPCDIFKGMRIILTQNRDKRNGVVNGQTGLIMMMSGSTVFVKLPNGKVVSVYPVSAIIRESENDGPEKARIKTCYPFVPGYALTICKSQGQTLDNVVVWFDTETLGSGTAYVALSRVKSLQNIAFLTPLQLSHFRPVTFETSHEHTQ